MEKKKIDTLVIIGNGFDRWQGLDTSYESFRCYYLKHRDEILKKLGIEKKYFIENGEKHYFTDVELIYGDPFDPGELDAEFWGTFEASLDQIDSERINYFFGKEDDELYEMQECIERAQAILREAFCDWVRSIEIDERPPEYSFGENCYCINFNYTDTLKKRFRVVHENHIHGEADDPESIIFGHSSHPQEPTPELMQFGGRFRGLYLVESALADTDKNVDDNIHFLCFEMSMLGIQPEDIEHIYVLGHSLGPADLGYFDFLVRSTSVEDPRQSEDSIELIDTDFDPLEDMHLRIQYAIHRYGEGSPTSPEEEFAVARRYAMERAELEREERREFEKLLRRGRRGRLFGRRRKKEKEAEYEPVPVRTRNADWHISWFTDDDEKRVRAVMDALGCKDYTPHHGIDECIEPFRCG